MLKVTKIEIKVNEFIKEVEALFPGKFTEAGLRVLFEYIENWENGEYELNKIEKEFEEWTYEEYRNYIAKRFGKTSDTEKERNSITKEELQTFLREEIYEEDQKDSLVGFTDSTIMFTSYYTSHLEYELKKNMS